MKKLKVKMLTEEQKQARIRRRHLQSQFSPIYISPISNLDSLSFEDMMNEIFAPPEIRIMAGPSEPKKRGWFLNFFW